MVWNEIQVYILAPKFKEVCSNIAKRSGLHDDLYQELILTLLEKIQSRKDPLLRAWENKYIDWYIVSTADRIFRSNHSVIGKIKFYSTMTGSTEVQYETVDTNTEAEFEEMLQLCETELGKQYWYNSKLFKQYALEDTSVRKLEAKTGIPRNSIHRTIKETRKVIVKKSFQTNINLLIEYKKTMSWKKLSKKTGIPVMTLYDMLAKYKERTENLYPKNQTVVDKSGTTYDFMRWKNIALTFLKDLNPGESEYESQIVFTEDVANILEVQLKKEDKYHATIFNLHTLNGLSIRDIELKTGLRRSTIHRSLQGTRERLKESIGNRLKIAIA